LAARDRDDAGIGELKRDDAEGGMHADELERLEGCEADRRVKEDAIPEAGDAGSQVGAELGDWEFRGEGEGAEVDDHTKKELVFA
jgi:hypothetical protein